MIWPEGYAADSIDFRLSLLPDGFLAAAGFDSTYKGQMSFGAFAVRMPKYVPALPVRGGGHIVYPHNSQFRHVTGQVIAEFVVDTTGRAEMSTFHDVWPADKPRLEGPLGRYYKDFVSSIRNYAAKAKFTPARIGSCTVPQWVRIPVRFRPAEAHQRRGALTSHRVPDATSFLIPVNTVNPSPRPESLPASA